MPQAPEDPVYVEGTTIPNPGENHPSLSDTLFGNIHLLTGSAFAGPDLLGPFLPDLSESVIQEHATLIASPETGSASTENCPGEKILTMPAPELAGLVTNFHPEISGALMSGLDLLTIQVQSLSASLGVSLMHAPWSALLVGVILTTVALESARGKKKEKEAENVFSPLERTPCYPLFPALA